MKQIKRIMIVLTVIVFVAIAVIYLSFNKDKAMFNQDYLVEVNRIYQEIQVYVENHKQEQIGMELSNKDFITGRGYHQVRALSYWKEGEMDQKDFFEGKNALRNSQSYLLPLSLMDTGYSFVRFEYMKKEETYSSIQLVLILVLIVMWLITMVVLSYVLYHILRPFHKLEQLPYELSKGHLSNVLKENRYRYFGKFLWGMDALRETLKQNQIRQLELEKEKKMLILSVSHDVKTPLSSIYLYIKALKEGLYGVEKQQDVYYKLQQKAEQIEGFVAEIEKMSTQDLFKFSVDVTNCYIKDMIEPIEMIYKEKLTLNHTRFTIEKYPNKLVKADKDRVVEVMENILENAMKYGDGKEITISSTEEEYCLLITIKNSGVPVEEKEFNHLFESFWRGGNAGSHKGSGLGLYICKELMTKMGGEIYATKEENSMSFTLVLREE